VRCCQFTLHHPIQKNELYHLSSACHDHEFDVAVAQSCAVATPLSRQRRQQLALRRCSTLPTTLQQQLLPDVGVTRSWPARNS
jgi:uncharacterized protein YjiS (DUF1127 family)